MTGASELDRLALGPDAAYSGAAPRPPRPPARRRGEIELAVAADLRSLPDGLRKGGIARTALRLARALDTGGMTPRDEAGHARELRMALMTLTEMAPGERKGDDTDEVRERRERRLSSVAPGN